MTTLIYYKFILLVDCILAAQVRKLRLLFKSLNVSFELSNLLLLGFNNRSAITQLIRQLSDELNLAVLSFLRGLLLPLEFLKQGVAVLLMVLY